MTRFQRIIKHNCITTLNHVHEIGLPTSSEFVDQCQNVRTTLLELTSPLPEFTCHYKKSTFGRFSATCDKATWLINSLLFMRTTKYKTLV